MEQRYAKECCTSCALFHSQDDRASALLSKNSKVHLHYFLLQSHYILILFAGGASFIIQPLKTAVYVAESLCFYDIFSRELFQIYLHVMILGAVPRYFHNHTCDSKLLILISVFIFLCLHCTYNVKFFCKGFDRFKILPLYFASFSDVQPNLVVMTI